MDESTMENINNADEQEDEFNKFTTDEILDLIQFESLGDEPEDELNKFTTDSVEYYLSKTTDEILDLIQFESLGDEPEEEIYDCTLMDEQNIDQDVLVANQECTADLDDISGSLVGMRRETIDEMYDLYCKHARAMGFSVRKGTNRISSDANPIVVGKLFTCSAAGMRISTVEKSSTKKKSTALTRTNCSAQMRIKRSDDRVFEVVKHTLEHNHALTRNEWSHLHRSARKITDEKARAIEDMLRSGMRAAESFRYMAHQVGGEENLGHTMKDHMNYVNRWKLNNIEGGDAKNVLDMMKNQEKEEEDFFYKVKKNDDGRLTEFFWRDSMMRDDYEIYGDVMVFDTTYRTNRYNLICAPFVGVNNHWRNTMFGCAFISDEKIETFEWLFNEFKKSMGGKCPVTIFTDQDKAIAKAIKRVFPTARHRLCLWHLQQNSISRFAGMKCGDSLKIAFTKCLSGCSDEQEFKDCWKNMISSYKLENNTWFKRLYKLKEKWCTALSKNFFSAGIRSSQRSESTNHAIGFSAKKNTSLTDFYGIFKDTIKRWRSIEQLDEFNSTRAHPESYMQMIGMLKQASEVYTLKLFKIFEIEFEKCVTASSKIVGVEDGKIVYNVTSSMGDDRNQVSFEYAMNLITCSCMKFEEFGILCYHCLRILEINYVQRIPDAYILQRWTKLAKSEVWNKRKRENYSLETNDDCITWRHETMRRLYNIVLKSERNKEARNIIDEGCNKFSIAIDALPLAQSMDTLVDSEPSNAVLDPSRVTTKGRSKRLKGHLEKKNKNNRKRKSVSTSDLSKEFGSKTPNPRLF